MLTILTGKAGTGKTGAVMEEISRNVAAGIRSILIVPEQYSHEAERELARVCGPKLSLYAEVMSFTGFARYMDRQLGSSEFPLLDKGGQLLCMSLAITQVFSQLRIYGAARKQVSLQNQLLQAVTELKTACITPEQLLETAQVCGGILGDKLHDLALLSAMYDGIVAEGHTDPTDRLSRLAQQIPDGDLQGIRFYLDGFTDFTRQQRNILGALLDKGNPLTVCLTCDVNAPENEVFAIPLSTARILKRVAEERNIPVTERQMETENAETPLNLFGDLMFTYGSGRTMPEQTEISLYAGDSIAAECEFAAAKTLELVRETGCRWREIAIAVRGFSEYETILDSTFRKYGIPLYFTQKTDVLSKPLPRLITAAYEIFSGGWEADDVLTYLRTGLTGLTPEECDLLENYVLLWNLRGNAWTREGNWTMHPDGFSQNFSDSDRQLLDTVNALRRRAAGPLLQLLQKADAAETAHAQVAALADFLEQLHAAQILERQANTLEANGYPQQAAECAGLWEITLQAMEQFDGLLADLPMDRETFAKLFGLMLSQYNIGTIPVAVDRVSAGDMDRMRRRNLKHLIVLGASDRHLPQPEETSGIFTQEDRTRLLENGLDLGSCGDAELWREFTIIYNCLTLPKNSLMLTYPDDGTSRPSIVMTRAEELFALPVERIDTARCKYAAHDSALELAAVSLRGVGNPPAAMAAAEYFKETEPERFAFLKAAAAQSRGQLSRRCVELLYGKKPRLSASRIDKFASCRFAYFLQYGLNARPRQPAAFAPPEQGTFMHYVLEHVAGGVMELGGFQHADETAVHRLTDEAIERYVHEFLNDFREKTPRFIYLFRRLTKDVRAVVDDMAAELRRSRFEPLSFELDFGRNDQIPPMEIGDGDNNLILTGIADRVDGWEHDGKLYLRVVDYKTGKKEFTLSDVWYGMNLQMLLYLFTLEQCGPALYGKPVVPAGVLYVPAYSKAVRSTENLSDEEIAKQQMKEHLRSGLILQDEAVIAAMENNQGEAYQYLPVAVKKRGADVPEALATAEQMGLLARHIDLTLQELARELKAGSIAADPYYKSQQQSACQYCDYADACAFEDGRHGDQRRYLPKLPATKVWSLIQGEVNHG